jgi:hypothetical protein
VEHTVAHKDVSVIGQRALYLFGQTAWSALIADLQQKHS